MPLTDQEFLDNQLFIFMRYADDNGTPITPDTITTFYSLDYVNNNFVLTWNHDSTNPNITQLQSQYNSSSLSTMIDGLKTKYRRIQYQQLDYNNYQALESILEILNVDLEQFFKDAFEEGVVYKSGIEYLNVRELVEYNTGEGVKINNIEFKNGMVNGVDFANLNSKIDNVNASLNIITPVQLQSLANIDQLLKTNSNVTFSTLTLTSVLNTVANSSLMINGGAVIQKDLRINGGIYFSDSTNPLNSYQSNSFQTYWTRDGSKNTQTTVSYTKIGNQITLTLPIISVTSSGVNPYIYNNTPLPNNLIPSEAFRSNTFRITRNGKTSYGHALITNQGFIQIYTDASETTTFNSLDVDRTNITYNL